MLRLAFITPAAMTVLCVLPDLPDFYTIFIDEPLLAFVSFPILIFFYLRPMLTQIALQQASEQRFRAVFEQIFQFMSILNPDGTILEANQSAVLASETDPTTRKGTSFGKRLPTLFRPQSSKPLKQPLAEN